MTTLAHHPVPPGRALAGPLASAAARVAFVLALLTSAMAGIAYARPVASQAEPDLPATAAVVLDTALAYLSVELELGAEQWAQTNDLLERAGFPGALQDLRQSILANTGLATPTAGDDADPLFGSDLGVVVTELPADFVDAMAAASGAATPAATPDPLAPTSAVEAFASVITTENNVQRISSILYVGDR